MPKCISNLPIQLANIEGLVDLEMGDQNNTSLKFDSSPLKNHGCSTFGGGLKLSAAIGIWNTKTVCFWDWRTRNEKRKKMIWWILLVALIFHLITGGKGRQWILPSSSKFPLRFGVLFFLCVLGPNTSSYCIWKPFVGTERFCKGHHFVPPWDHLVVSILTLPYPRSSKWFEHQIWIEFPKEQTDIDTLQFLLFQSNVIFNFNICESTRNFASLQSFPCPFFVSNRGLAACVSTAGRIQTKQRRDAGWVTNVHGFFVNSPNKKDL